MANYDHLTDTAAEAFPSMIDDSLQYQTKEEKKPVLGYIYVSFLIFFNSLHI